MLILVYLPGQIRHIFANLKKHIINDMEKSYCKEARSVHIDIRSKFAINSKGIPALGLAFLMMHLIMLSCSERSTPSSTGSFPRADIKFQIVVIGDGVPGASLSPVRQFYINRSQGRAMWEGAKAALDLSSTTEKLRDYIQLTPLDDGGSAGVAEKLANRLRQDPTVLAVIGHATSATTRAAANIYADAGIPLIMPIATGPFVPYPPGNKGMDRYDRLRNCFRLPPNDQPAQAKAVSFVARDILNAKRCFLLRDVTSDAEEYSSPLYHKIDSLLSDLVIGRLDVNRELYIIQDIAWKIDAQKSDVVVFCGYGSTAQEILYALRQTYSKRPAAQRPRLVLTDGCKIADLDVTGFDVYLTFPLPSLETCKPPTADIKILESIVPKFGDESYQMYGYDAMLLVAKAIVSCGTQVSRDRLVAELSSIDSRGAFLSYKFEDGENEFAEYWVLYSESENDSVSQPFIQEAEIPARILR